MTAPAREREVLAAAVESLRPELRKVLVEAYFKGRTVSEAADVLGLPVREVKARIYHALRELRSLPAVTAGRTVRPVTARGRLAA